LNFYYIEIIDKVKVMTGLIRPHFSALSLFLF